MKTIRGSKNLKGKPGHTVLTLGNFDGMHLAHQEIVTRVVQLAKRARGKSVLYTFEPHPVKILAPELAPPILQTLEQKLALLEKMGLDICIVERFSKDLAGLSAPSFFDKILRERIGADHIIIGYDFTFGLHRSGTIEELTKLASPHKIKVEIAEAIFHEESLISSTHIRHFVETGKIEAANAMLGRPYSIIGTVVKGRGIGAELGFHTANLEIENDLSPPPGVYITTTILTKGDKTYKSATNIGYNPTFGGNRLSVETHLIDFCGELYGEKMELLFHKKIRREMTFESTEELRTAVKNDIKKAREYHEKGI